MLNALFQQISVLYFFLPIIYTTTRSVNSFDEAGLLTVLERTRFFQQLACCTVWKMLKLVSLEGADDKQQHINAKPARNNIIDCN